MDIFAKRVVAQDTLREIHRSHPILLAFRHSRQRFEHAQKLFAIIRALLLYPIVVTALHEVAAIKHDGLFITVDAAIEIAGATARFPVSNQPVENFHVNAVRELRIELILAISISDEVLS